ncbi:hypothetical protein AAMO2058_000205900 [Amorphochlora amoebiformis]
MSCEHKHETSEKEGSEKKETKTLAKPLELKFIKGAHIRYFLCTLKMMPEDFEGFDTKRMMIAYLCLSGLDVLNALDKLPMRVQKETIEWIYAAQKTPGTSEKKEDKTHYGFRGGSSWGGAFDVKNRKGREGIPKDEAHIAMTYSALCALKILGDDLSRVDKKAIIGSLKLLQRENGCFRCATTEEDDMRFMYCACAISDMLGDWSGVNKEKATQYIIDAQAFDGGIGLRVGAEGHGGTTYCAIASLVLMGNLNSLKDLPGLIRWCVYAQGAGFVGRPNKPADSCYSFWIGATMKMLGVYDLTNKKENQTFNLRCQTKYGGFGKYPDVYPDPLHSYFGICGLSMMGLDSSLAPIDPLWGLTLRAAGKEPKK